MKKIFACLLLLAVALAAFACGEYSGDVTTFDTQITSTSAQTSHTTAHVHNFHQTVSEIPFTCYEYGSVTKKCACGETKTQTIPPMHQFVNEVCTVCLKKASKLGYISNDDGTCYVSAVYRDGKKDIIVPHVSPFGDIVIGIGDQAFYFYNEIETVELPATLTYIGKEAFADCANLRSVNIPDGVESIDARAFYWCEKLESVKIPGSVESIGDQAFAVCRSLVNLELADGVGSIGNKAFAACSALEEVALPNTVFEIGMLVFSECTALKRLTVAEGCYAYSAVNNCLIDNRTQTAIAICGEFKLPGGGLIKHIADGLFYKNNYITEIVIPDGVETIGDEVFVHCENLRSVILPESLCSIGEKAFYFCVSLEKISIPGGVEKIGAQTFFNCTSLIDLKLGDGVEYISSNAFAYCIGIREVIFPESLKYIEGYVFNGCTSLVSLTFENTQGWLRSNGNNFDGGEPFDVSNPSQNATLFNAYYRYIYRE